MAEFIAKSATENVAETLVAEIAGALVVAVEETGTNRNKKNRPSLGGFFVVNFRNLVFVL